MISTTQIAHNSFDKDPPDLGGHDQYVAMWLSCSHKVIVINNYLLLTRLWLLPRAAYYL